jgi:hypothetical protein
MAGDWTVTLRIDTSAWSANREYPVMNVLPFGGGMGHAWLTIAAPNGDRVDIGYYPLHGGVAGVGELRTVDISHQPHQDAAYTYHVTAEHAARMLAGAEKIQAEPGWYNGVSHNCLTVARELMVLGGVPMPPIMPERGLNSVTAWKTGSPVEPGTPRVHDPANYNLILRSTPEGQAARGLYQKSSELSAAPKTNDLPGLTHQAQAQAAYETHLQPEHSTYLGEVDSPQFLAGDPQQSVVDHGGATYLGEVDSPNFLAGGDPHMSTVDTAGFDAHPGMSVDTDQTGGFHPDPGLSFDDHNIHFDSNPGQHHY